MLLTQVLITTKTFSIFGKKLAAARVRVGLSQAELAARIGRSVGSVQKMEGQHIANVFLSRRTPIMEALRMTEAEFMRDIAVSGASPAAYPLDPDLDAALRATAARRGITPAEAHDEAIEQWIAKYENGNAGIAGRIKPAGLLPPARSVAKNIDDRRHPKRRPERQDPDKPPS
jgi:transcriptional regulator with XRE-family HTH domain